MESRDVSRLRRGLLSGDAEPLLLRLERDIERRRLRRRCIVAADLAAECNFCGAICPQSMSQKLERQLDKLDAKESGEKKEPRKVFCCQGSSFLQIGHPRN